MKLNRPQGETRTKERKKRPPVNGQGDVLSFEMRKDGYVYYMFNDKVNRIV